jgi:hypothetical protein
MWTPYREKTLVSPWEETINRINSFTRFMLGILANRGILLMSSEYLNSTSVYPEMNLEIGCLMKVNAKRELLFSMRKRKKIISKVIYISFVCKININIIYINLSFNVSIRSLSNGRYSLQFLLASQGNWGKLCKFDVKLRE